ncbi:ADP compounds hydrolase NudE [Hydrogenovibrio sp. SC-1]|uniref:ADP compounds hydrolase NudE n=1 Tax=Hydrogenovibrio sp. SC-1 TaxID=2065820 RepID=UPI000C7A0208|nr:ADP compounds hydrolase NudE [Hydrogenovibrio sp. SC-1]PLA74575.1 ADP compounds hydrolase NudE [Hydrogenovibrio sp. SC-1]
MKKNPTILSKTALAKTKLFQVEGLELLFENQTQVQFERLVSSQHGAVLIVPIIDDSLVLIREYAAGVERYELGFPKGKIDPGETWREAALRESQEEVGFLPGLVTLLDSVTLAASYMSHQTHIILAEDLCPSEAEGDEPEPLEVIYWPLSDWHRLIQQPEFSEGRAYAALMLVLKRLGRLD